VGENVVVEKTILSDSIIGSYSRLESIILKHSVVGNDATLKGKSQSVNIGDSTEIDFNE
jgi:glucose-1-phosphate thymidylyltransferase